MPKLNHIAIPVKDWAQSRDWYVKTLGMGLEFEIPDRLVAAVKDDSEFAIFLHQAPVPAVPIGFALTIQVADVQASFQQITQKGITFAFIELLKIEDVLVEGHRLFHIAHLYRDMVASINLNAHPGSSPFTGAPPRGRRHRRSGKRRGCEV